jgi:phage FluMu gp28-like protein
MGYQPSAGPVRSTSPAQQFFLPYQAGWIVDESPMKLAEKSRRVGYTYATSYRCVQKCLTRPRGFTQWVSSRDLLTAKEFVTDYVAKWARAANVAAKGLAGDNAQVIDAERGITALVAEFETGNRIVSLSSTPEAFAGKGGDVLLDEVDLHEDAGRLVDMALPCTVWGGQLEAISAYRVDGSPSSVFARLCTDAKAANPMGWRLYRVTIEDAVAQGFAEKLSQVTGKLISGAEFLARERAKCRTEAAWLSQFMCQPQDDGGALLPYSLIAGCEEDRINGCVGAALPAEFLAGADASRTQYYVGADIGRQHDLTVFWVLERVGDVFWTRWVCELQKVTFREQLAVLETVLRLPRVQRCCIDATGIGAMLAEEAQLKHGQYKVEALQFTAPVKAELAMPMLASFQDRAVRIPALPAVREDLHKVRKTTTAAGNVRFEASSDDAGHADRFWALALALHAGESGLGGPVHGALPTADDRVGDGYAGRMQSFLQPDNAADDAGVGELVGAGSWGAY